MTALAIWALVKRFWWGIPLVAMGAVLIVAKADARHWHKQADHYRTQLAMIQAEAAQATVAANERVKQAEATYDARAAALQPVIVRSVDTVRTYAQTPAGRASCVSADRVRGIDALDATLRDTPAPASGANPVPADASAPPSGR